MVNGPASDHTSHGVDPDQSSGEGLDHLRSPVTTATEPHFPRQILSGPDDREGLFELFRSEGARNIAVYEGSASWNAPELSTDPAHVAGKVVLLTSVRGRDAASEEAALEAVRATPLRFHSSDAEAEFTRNLVAKLADLRELDPMLTAQLLVLPPFDYNHRFPLEILRHVAPRSYEEQRTYHDKITQCPLIFSMVLAGDGQAVLPEQLLDRKGLREYRAQLDEAFSMVSGIGKGRVLDRALARSFIQDSAPYIAGLREEFLDADGREPSRPSEEDPSPISANIARQLDPLFHTLQAGDQAYMLGGSHVGPVQAYLPSTSPRVALAARLWLSSVE